MKWFKKYIMIFVFVFPSLLFAGESSSGYLKGRVKDLDFKDVVIRQSKGQFKFSRKILLGEQNIKKGQYVYVNLNVKVCRENFSRWSASPQKSKQP